MQHGRVLLVIPYFGKFGPWFPLYLRSLAKQHTLDLLLLSDETPPCGLPPNARHVAMTFGQLRTLATQKLGVRVLLRRSRNICDLRPAYGIVFQQFIGAYEYWAFGDEDVLYGDVDRLLWPHLDANADFVIPAANGKSGHLTIVRNDPRASTLVMTDPAYPNVLVSDEHWAYDETSWRYGHVSSFHEVVKDAESSGRISVQWGIPRGTGLPARGKHYVYNGRTIRDEAGAELLYYHWGKLRFRVEHWPVSGPFAFDRYGMYESDLKLAQRAGRRATGRMRELLVDVRDQLRRTRFA